MTQQQGITIHETLQLHEILAAKTVCLTKAKARQSFIQDAELKSLLQQDIQTTAQSIQDVQSLLSQATFTV